MNVLNSFLVSAKNSTRIAWRAVNQPAVRPDQYEAFTRNSEERNYAQELLARVEMLSFTFERLCELRGDYFRIHEAMRESQSHPNGIDCSKVAPADLERYRRWNLEGDVLTAFAYYELKSVVDMLQGWNIAVVVGAELEYILKTRDRFLAHPQYRGVMRLANRGRSIPGARGPVGVSIAGLSQWDSITRQHYLKELKMDAPVDEEFERRKNEQLVISKTRNHRWDLNEIVRLKAFGVREADLPAALKELGSVLEGHALPKIEAAFDEAVTCFGFERY